MSDIVIEALMDKRKLIETEFNEKLKQIDTAIKDHRMRSLRADKNHSPSVFRLKADSLEIGIRSVSDAVRKVIEDMDGNFTLKEVKEVIQRQFPHFYNEKTAKGIGPRLWEACSEGVLELVSPGKGGKPNIYARKKAPAPQ